MSSPFEGDGFNETNPSVPIQAAEGLKAAIYARTSSTQQRHGYSINEQVRQCWERCEQFGWTVSHVFRDKEVSGKDTDREKFQKLLAGAKAGLFDVVVFWKLDRFSRSLMNTVQLERQLRDWDVGLHSVTEQIDTTTATGRFNFRSISSASELERDLIKQRTQMGLRALALDNKWPNNNPPLGYEIREDGRLDIVPQEADLVRWIFDRYIECQSMPALANELTDKRGGAGRNVKWSTYAVGEILRNELYLGHYSVAGVEEYVEEYQIVDEETFEDATNVRTRFQQTQDSDRPEMPRDRKQSHIETITDQYTEYLDQRVCSDDS